MKLSFPRGHAKVEIVYQGITFTIARATIENGGKKKIVAEGVARRSFRDPLDKERGADIAFGRALKALERKYRGERIYHHLMG